MKKMEKNDYRAPKILILGLGKQDVVRTSNGVEVNYQGQGWGSGSGSFDTPFDK